MNDGPEADTGTSVVYDTEANIGMSDEAPLQASRHAILTLKLFDTIQALDGALHTGTNDNDPLSADTSPEDNHIDPNTVQVSREQAVVAGDTEGNCKESQSSVVVSECHICLLSIHPR